MPDERWNVIGAVTAACWSQGKPVPHESDTLSRITPGKQLEDWVMNLAGKGDHQSNIASVLYRLSDGAASAFASLGGCRGRDA